MNGLVKLSSGASIHTNRVQDPGKMKVFPMFRQVPGMGQQ
jgi:hypothetical protein